MLGGAKVSDKLMLVENLLARVDALLVGGGMAYTFLRALGHDVGRSLVEADRVETARRRPRVGAPSGDARSCCPWTPWWPRDSTVRPGDWSGIREIPAAQMGLDIGPATVERFAEALKPARTIVWNGPMGVFEKAPFAAGTLGVARAVVAATAFSVIGGGDTVSAVRRAGVADKIGYISTAGGAFLEFLEGRTLPGVEALTDSPQSAMKRTAAPPDVSR